MKFSVSSSLLDACVLGVIAKNETYGYDLTQRIQATIEVSESTLYPVLRRLLKDGALESYDAPFDGRNRRYYKITQSGEGALVNYREVWRDYRDSVDNLIMGVTENE